MPRPRLVSPIPVGRVVVEAFLGVCLDVVGQGVHIAAGVTELVSGPWKIHLGGERERGGEALASTTRPSGRFVELVLQVADVGVQPVDVVACLLPSGLGPVEVTLVLYVLCGDWLRRALVVAPLPVPFACLGDRWVEQGVGGAFPPAGRQRGSELGDRRVQVRQDQLPCCFGPVSRRSWVLATPGGLHYG